MMMLVSQVNQQYTTAVKSLILELQQKTLNCSLPGVTVYAKDELILGLERHTLECTVPEYRR